MMSEKDLNSQPPSDPVWASFEASEAARLEEKFREVERYNRFKLNLAAGLEDQTFRLADNGEEIDGTQLTISGGMAASSFELWLQPDRRDELDKAGESPVRAWAYGEPAVVVGPVPERVQKLIDELLDGVGAQLDDERSTPSDQTWKGDIAGQPIWISMHHSFAEVEDEKGVKVRQPVISMRAQSEGMTRALDEEQATKAKASSETDGDTCPADDRNTGGSSENKLDRTDRPARWRNWLRNILG